MSEKKSNPQFDQNNLIEEKISEMKGNPQFDQNNQEENISALVNDPRFDSKKISEWIKFDVYEWLISITSDIEVLKPCQKKILEENIDGPKLLKFDSQKWTEFCPDNLVKEKLLNNFQLLLLKDLDTEEKEEEKKIIEIGNKTMMIEQKLNNLGLIPKMSPNILLKPFDISITDVQQTNCKIKWKMIGAEANDVKLKVELIEKNDLDSDNNNQKDPNQFKSIIKFVKYSSKKTEYSCKIRKLTPNKSYFVTVTPLNVKDFNLKFKTKKKKEYIAIIGLNNTEKIVLNWKDCDNSLKAESDGLIVNCFRGSNFWSNAFSQNISQGKSLVKVSVKLKSTSRSFFNQQLADTHFIFGLVPEGSIRKNCQKSLIRLEYGIGFYGSEQKIFRNSGTFDERTVYSDGVVGNPKVGDVLSMLINFKKGKLQFLLNNIPISDEIKLLKKNLRYNACLSMFCIGDSIKSV